MKVYLIIALAHSLITLSCLTCTFQLNIRYYCKQRAISYVKYVLSLTNTNCTCTYVTICVG